MHLQRLKTAASSSGALTILAVCAALVRTAAAAPASDPLEGIWVSETRFGPALQGELTLRRTRDGWHATIGGLEAGAPASAAGVYIAFPDDKGVFRGGLTSDGQAVEGFWRQPTGATQDRRDPGGSGQSFVTPVVLRAASSDTWQGAVRPLEDRFTLYLRIFRNAEGALVGAFRNPELNLRGGASHFRVTSEDDNSVVFTARPYDTEVRHTAELLKDPERLGSGGPTSASSSSCGARRIRRRSSCRDRPVSRDTSTSALRRRATGGRPRVRARWGSMRRSSRASCSA